MIVSSRGRGQQRGGQSAIRHKVRNLRAKVRLLLPTDVCCKYNKRTKNLIKMLNSKSAQGVREVRWGHRREGSEELYVPHETAKSEKHLFYKLTTAEIQQIKEDKLYYVGEEFIEDFDQFLQKKEGAFKMKGGRLAPTQSIPQLSGKMSTFQKTISSNYTESSVDKENSVNYRIRNACRFEEILQKRKMISEQQQSHRGLLKVKLQQKEERHMLNFQRASAMRQNSIKRWNEAHEVKTSQSIRVKHGRSQAGQITQLSEKLRSLCLQRHNDLRA